MEIGIVGAGIVGLAVARAVLRAEPDARVTVIEKEPAVGRHQTGHNSGVVHAGLYYRPGSLKAELCHRGRAMMREYCAEHSLPFDRVGKVVVAADESELDGLAEIERRSVANAVPGLRRLDAAGLAEIEPRARGVAALHSPHTAVTDFATVARCIADEVIAAGGTILLRSEVTGVREIRGGVGVMISRSAGPGGSIDDASAANLIGVQRTRSRGIYDAPAHNQTEAAPRVLSFDRLVICAGLQSDRVAADDADPRIIPFLGMYYALRPQRRDLVRGLIYPVPDDRFPFLGVHLTRTVRGEVLVGPNAVLGLAREAYRALGFNAGDTAATLTWPGFYRVAARYWRAGASELLGAASKRRFLAAAQRYVPELTGADLLRAPLGVRAQAVTRSGTLADDFVLHDRGPVIAVRNAPSPAATSSLAIADYLLPRILPGAGAS